MTILGTAKPSVLGTEKTPCFGDKETANHLRMGLLYNSLTTSSPRLSIFRDRVQHVAVDIDQEVLILIELRR